MPLPRCAVQTPRGRCARTAVARPGSARFLLTEALPVAPAQLHLGLVLAVFLVLMLMLMLCVSGVLLLFFLTCAERGCCGCVAVLDVVVRMRAVQLLLPRQQRLGLLSVPAVPHRAWRPHAQNSTATSMCAAAAAIDSHTLPSSAEILQHDPSLFITSHFPFLAPGERERERVCVCVCVCV